MGRSPDERLTTDLARDLCLREGSKAMLSESIASLGRQYILTLNAVNCQSGDSLAQQQAEASSKEQVLSALGSAVWKLRGTLGESLASVQAFDVPIEQVTTTSLDALKIPSCSRGALNFLSAPTTRREFCGAFALVRGLLHGATMRGLTGWVRSAAVALSVR